MRLLSIVCFALLAALSHAENALVDLSGFYTPARNLEIEAAKDFIDALPDDVVLLEDSSYIEYGPMEFGGLKLKPHALEEAKKWTPEDELKPEKQCRTPSIVYAMQGPFPVELHQGRDIIILHLEYFDIMRPIFLDGREHLPEDMEHSARGHSIGHWEGDVLVVDTTHLREGVITNNGLNHSDDTHVVERFRLSPDGKQLWMTQMFEDPTNLDNRGARFMAWNRVPGEHVLPYECSPFVYME